jgi:hypothetical protein
MQVLQDAFPITTLQHTSYRSIFPHQYRHPSVFQICNHCAQELTTLDVQKMTRTYITAAPAAWDPKPLRLHPLGHAHGIIVVQQRW